MYYVQEQKLLGLGEEEKVGVRGGVTKSLLVAQLLNAFVSFGIHEIVVMK